MAYGITGVPVPLGEHAATIAGDLTGVTRSLVQEIHRETHEVALATAIALSPVGGAGDKHPGLLRRSWESDPSNVADAITALEPTSVINRAPHALIIDLGRRMGERAYTTKAGAGMVMVPTKRRRKDGSVVMRKRRAFRVAKPRMLGSEKAPLGVKGPVLRKLSAEREAIFARAAAAVERKGPP
jgi:hypothetical protein